MFSRIRSRFVRDVFYRHLATLLLSLSWYGCGDGGTINSAQEPTPQPVSITVSPASISVRTQGKQQLSVRIGGTSDTARMRGANHEAQSLVAD